MAIETLGQLLAAEFGQLDLDRAVLDAWASEADFSIDQTALSLGQTSGDVAASITRLSARQLLARPIVAAAASQTARTTGG